MADAEWLVCGGCTIDIEQNAVDKHTEKKRDIFLIICVAVSLRSDETNACLTRMNNGDHRTLNIAVYSMCVVRKGHDAHHRTSACLVCVRSRAPASFGLHHA